MAKEEKQLENLNRLVISILKGGTMLGTITVLCKVFKIEQYSWLVAWSPFILGWGIWLLYFIALCFVGLLLIILKDGKPKKTYKIDNKDITEAISNLRNKRKGRL
jgi:hypothetical protein